MKIERIDVYRVALDSRDGGQKLSGGRTIANSTSIVVGVTTDTGLTGWGESAPWGPQYLPTFAEAIIAGLTHLAPVMIGCDPRAIGTLHDRLSAALYRQPYIVSALDIACWDLAGQAAGLPVFDLLGGTRSPDPFISAYIGAAKDNAFAQRISEFRSHGVTQFSAKLSGDVTSDIDFIKSIAAEMGPGESLKVDTNRGWRCDQAIRVAALIPRDLDIYFEQPCESYEDNRDFRRTSGRPLILDEGATDLETLLRAWGDGVLDAVNVKIARHGGLSGARVVRDTLAALRVPMHIQDMGGSDLARAAICHLAYSTPSDVLLYVWDPKNLVETTTAAGGATVANLRMSISPTPGLGVKPLTNILGAPIAVCDVAGFRRT